MQHILAIGVDPSLLRTRGLVLEKSGALVTIADPRQGLHFLEGRRFDMLVLCHSLDEKDVRKSCAASREGSPTKILLIETLGAIYRIPVDVDARFQLEDGPALLVKIVRMLLAGKNADPVIGCATHPVSFIPSSEFGARPRKTAPPGQTRLPSKVGLITLKDASK